jgi:urea carboxylase
MFNKLLIANRGAIACRILRTLKTLGVQGVAVYSESDMASLHIQQAEDAVSLGEGPAANTYLNVEKILSVAKDTGATAIHPGYGFLSENAAFAEACESVGIAFIGPTPEQLRVFGLKHTARAIAKAQGVPMLEGSELLDTVEDALSSAASVGYPVMLKSTAGGGGIGMRVCRSAAELSEAYDTVRRLGQNNFSDSGVFIEKYIERARHLEVQVFGDGKGDVIALGVRDCSVQRRNQKVLEETPAPNLPMGMPEQLCAAAIQLAKAVQYRSAGTVEFVYDSLAEQFYFLEVNTRLQVEHGVTEQVWGVDLVRWMIELAAGDLPPLSTLKAQLKPNGHAIQARVYAEDPGKDFQPSPGMLTNVEFPVTDGKSLRIDTWVEAGCEIPPYFDPMIAKIISWSTSREDARTQLDRALADSVLYGVETNRNYLRQILADQPFVEGQAWTRCLEGLRYQSYSFEVVTPGTQTTVQDYPGRLGYWAVGVPPSGPMDRLAFQLGNRLLGNEVNAAGLEITMSGPTLRFHSETVIVITGAIISAKLDGQLIGMHQSVHVKAGAVLTLGKVTGAGVRSYLLLRGGIQVPDYLGSKSTFTLGQFGGHAGRALRVGDVLHLQPTADASHGNTIPADSYPALPAVRQLRVIYGPHGAPEYFTPQYIETFFATEWEVHFNSSRTGIRLIGPKPEWVRDSGGEAGLHPSNIHDNPYAIGAVDFTGDMPVILGPDGPSLGGFVCPVTIIEADLWQLGQLTAGDKLSFVPVSHDTARRLFQQQQQLVATLQSVSYDWQPIAIESPVVLDIGQQDARLVARLSGDTNLLLEIGNATLDLALRFKAHALMQALAEKNLAGIIDLTPGIRSLQVHYQPEQCPLTHLLVVIEQLWNQLSTTTDITVPSRIVHLPLSWDDPACQLAIEKYMTTVRKDAPWCPSNLEFIRRINALPDIETVQRVVFEASYLVMGLGDVYLGAPVATPLDPRHRLVTTKYNPARTWTAENSVGIGGAYMCIYGMEGPGGYQFVGRTLQMWNRYKKLDVFEGKPWLLNFFDQIRFYPVSAQALERIRLDFPLGRYPLKIEESSLNLADYQRFLEQEADGIAAFKAQQQAAFNAERQRWIESGQANFESDESMTSSEQSAALAENQIAVESHIAGNLWQVLVKVGQQVAAGESLVILESMKMEIEVHSPEAGIVSEIRVQPGSSVKAGQCVIVMNTL